MSLRRRSADPWPDKHGPGKRPGAAEKGADDKRTLQNSEVRPYSWPAVLVFVKEWVPTNHFCKGAAYDPDEIVPKTLYLPDGRRVPVCVIEAPREPKSQPTPRVLFPLNNVGGGRRILAGLGDTDKVEAGERVTNGCAAARKTVELMRSTFQLLPPSDIVEAYIDSKGAHENPDSKLWDNFGSQTIDVMKAGTQGH